MNLPKDFNTIMALVLILLIIVLYYGYYFLKDMMQQEIKDFYIKAEKSRIKKDKKDREIVLERENVELKNKLVEDINRNNRESDIFQLEDINNFNDIEIDNVDINKLEIESFVDPINHSNNHSKENDHAVQNKTLANRTFEI